MKTPLVAAAALVAAAVCLQCALAVRCVSCDTDGTAKCIADVCEGDYCVISTWRPQWGAIDQFGQKRMIRGCAEGNLLKGGISSHCENAGNGLSVCLCDADSCNYSEEDDDVQEIEMRTCVCQGSHCDGEETCLGEYCTSTKNDVTGEETKGCMQTSIPLIERRSQGGCMRPPMTGALHHSHASLDELLQMETCVCRDKDLCNRALPPDFNPKAIDKCPMRLTVKEQHVPSKTDDTGECKGEYCYRINLIDTSAESSMREYVAYGCITFQEQAELAEELNEEGCMRLTSETLEATACFTKKQPGAAADKVDNKSPKDGGGRRDAAPTTRAPMQVRPPKAEELPDENSNTALVTVFVLIMVAIVVVGVTKKFELHKKIFRARYDTVAG